MAADPAAVASTVVEAAASTVAAVTVAEATVGDTGKEL
jgi:hypothetical protein